MGRRGTGVALALGTGAAGAALNLFGRRPPWRRYPWYIAGLVPGLVGSELGGPAATAQAAAAGLALGLGAGRSRVGATGLAVAAAGALGLAGLHRSSVAAVDVLDAALVEALGPGTPGIGTEPDLVPVRAPLANLLVDRDVRYHDEAPEQVLDIWRRPGRDPERPSPVLLYVHGGSWTGGTKRQQSTYLTAQLARRDWLCLSIDYRLGPKHRWPTQIVDVKRALAWVKANISRYGGDPSFVAVCGGSAGGHLAALAALSGNDPAFQPGFEDADTSVQAAGLLYGVYDFTVLNDDGLPRLRNHVRAAMFDADLDDDRPTWEAASPTWRLDAAAPPMFVVHGDRDEVVEATTARKFAERAREVTRQPFAYAELPYAHHAFDFLPSPRARATGRAMSRFFEAVRARQEL
ncbi:MAG TPA: alpha/beta hydrolase [Pseudonocardiaceae bacterium]|jgi:acetyl esterase/lipase|nr:alpha/beta hydrolase [Pseudonocardiaceae bacterium]